MPKGPTIHFQLKNMETKNYGVGVLKDVSVSLIEREETGRYTFSYTEGSL